MQLLKNRQAFTLIELLVVIAIIGILSAAAVVNLNSGKEKAKQTKLLATMAQVQKVATVCMYDSRNLRCSGGPCNGSQLSKPIVGNAVCLGSTDSWPSLLDIDPNLSWGIAYSLYQDLDFCFEVAWQDPEIALSGGGVWSEQYYCNSEKCFENPTSASPCSVSGCQGFNEPCSSNSECCGTYTCNSGLCGTPQIST